MSDPLETITSLAGQLLHNGWGASRYPTKVITDLGGGFELANRTGLLRSSEWYHWLHMPDDSELNTIFKKLIPAPPTDYPDWETVASTLEQELASSSPNLSSGLQDLARLPWEGVWRVLDRLSDAGPSTNEPTYLIILEQALSELPDTDYRIVGAVTAAVIKRTKKFITAALVPSFARLSHAVLELDPQHQFEIMALLGIPPDDVEGLMVMMEAEVDEVTGGSTDTNRAISIARSPKSLSISSDIPSWLDRLRKIAEEIDVNADTFQDWTKKKQAPWGYFIGTSAHEVIAKHYELHHVHPLTYFNYSSVEAIVDSFIDVLQLKRGELGRVAKALARARPDILEFGIEEHGMPPGWIYEIKPAGKGAGAALAAFEAEFYANVLTLCNIPIVLGPAGGKGTEGVSPMPHGWVAFVSPMPGVIVYKYVRASRAAIEARGQVPVHAETTKKVQNLLDESAPEWLPYAAVVALLILAFMSRGGIRLVPA